MLLCSTPLLFLQFSVHGCDDFPSSAAFSVKAGLYTLQSILHFLLLLVLLRLLTTGFAHEETGGNPWFGGATRQSTNSMEHTPLKRKEQLVERSLESVEGRSGRIAWRSVRGLLCGCVCLNLCIYLLALAATCYQGVNNTMSNEWVRLTSIGSVIRNHLEGFPPMVVVDQMERQLAMSTVLKYRNGTRTTLPTCWKKSFEVGGFREDKCDEKYHPGDGHDFHHNRTNSKLVTFFRFYFRNETSPHPERQILYIEASSMDLLLLLLIIIIIIISIIVITKIPNRGSQ
ncbi:unnamed protein product [Dibothriocephalus latus]|uniref:Transmembrane protein n=1 Tax=Dibothriocephalus latus TaxID=60516 RepID=A0A3P7NL69_DIBLA|nr:unnamed protein product [Dibothriocephalus latus]